jgi:DNA-binding NarL/FixJ family response regulator
MKRKIRVCILASNPFIEAYIKSKFSHDHLVTFSENPSHEIDAFVFEQDILTPTEQKILQAIAELGTIEAVSGSLNYHRATVKRYLCRVYKKLKVKSSAQATYLAFKLGLIR